MALSGNFSTNKYTTSSHGTIGLNLSWTATQSIENNTSKISWTLKSNGSMSSSYYVQAGPVTVTINGTKVLNTTSRFSMHGGGGYKKSGTITVSHGSDGSKSVSMSVKAAIYSASVNCTGSKTYSLNKINRYALLGDAPNFNDEQNPTITFTNPAGTALVNNLMVSLNWNSGTSTTGYFNIPSSLWGGGSFTIPLTDYYKNVLRNAIPTSKTLNLEYDLKSTLNGTDYHSKKTAIMEIVNANPTPGEISYIDINPDVIAITNLPQRIIRLHSTLRIHTDAATAKKGASISSYSLSFNGGTYTPNGSGNVDFVKPNIAGYYSAVITVTDSRGNRTDAWKTVTITDWAQPSALYSWSRVQNFVTNDTILHVDGKYSAIPGSTMKITESHREKNTGSWSSPVEVPDDTDVTISGLDYQREYEMKVTVTDTFIRNNVPAGQVETVYTLGLGKGLPIAFFDALRHSVGVNGLPDADDQLYVGGNIKTTGGLTCNWINDRDITAGFTITKTSGHWDIYDFVSWRTGSVVQCDFILSGDGTSVSAGADGYVGNVSLGAFPKVFSFFMGMVGSVVCMGFYNPSDSTIHFRPISAAYTLASTGRLHFSGTFIV